MPICSSDHAAGRLRAEQDQTGDHAEEQADADLTPGSKR
jgi:hypothetical protein